MLNHRRALWLGLPLVLIVALGLRFALAQDQVPGWINKDGNWPAQKQRLQAFGERFKNSWEMYEYLQQAAGKPQGPTWTQMGDADLDWGGVYTRSAGGLEFDPDLQGPQAKTTARLTPAGLAVVQRKAEQLRRTGGEYDPLSDCRPPGVPRWFSEPFLHEFIVTPKQTWLINEMVNDIRRVYTDGRTHTPESDAYPLQNGDTIGFWDGNTLVAHTRYLMQGQYQRGVQPNTSEQTTVVERWHKVDARTLQADVWVFDPVNLSVPWYTRQSWTKLTNEDTALRIRYWDCRENANNSIQKQGDGTSDFGTLDFEKTPKH